MQWHVMYMICIHWLLLIFLSLRVFDEFFPNVYSQLQAHGFLIHIVFLRKYHKTHCHLEIEIPHIHTWQEWFEALKKGLEL